MCNILLARRLGKLFNLQSEMCYCILMIKIWTNTTFTSSIWYSSWKNFIFTRDDGQTPGWIWIQNYFSTIKDLETEKVIKAKLTFDKLNMTPRLYVGYIDFFFFLYTKYTPGIKRFCITVNCLKAQSKNKQTNKNDGEQGSLLSTLTFFLLGHYFLIREDYMSLSQGNSANHQALLH